MSDLDRLVLTVVFPVAGLVEMCGILLVWWWCDKHALWWWSDKRARGERPS